MTILEEEEESKKKIDRERQRLTVVGTSSSTLPTRERLRHLKRTRKRLSPVYGPSSSAERPNSDDEYGEAFVDEELEGEFAASLLKVRGFRIKPMRDDGSCMFRAIADQLLGEEERHDEVRRLCLDYMEKNRDHFSQFITEDFSAYIARKRRPNVHGNHAELQAVAELFSRSVEIYEYSCNPMNIFAPSGGGSEHPPLRLSYHGATHYNSVIDPFAPRRERPNLEDAMLRDKLRLGDGQRRDSELHSQTLRQSYEEYLAAFSRGHRVSPRNKRSREDSSPSPPLLKKKKKGSKSGSQQSSATASPARERQVSGSPPRSLYEELLQSSFNEFGDIETGNAAMLAQAMVLSQQEFLRRLRPDDDAPGSSRH